MFYSLEIGDWLDILVLFSGHLGLNLAAWARQWMAIGVGRWSISRAREMGFQDIVNICIVHSRMAIVSAPTLNLGF